MQPYYSEEHIKIFNGDCIRVMRELPAESVDLLMTDPPYSSGGAFRGDRIQATNIKYIQTKARRLDDFSGDSRDQLAWLAWMHLWLLEASRLLKPGAIAGFFCDWRQVSAAQIAFGVGGLVQRGMIGWDKTEACRPVPGRFRQQEEFVLWGTKGPRSIKEHTRIRPGSYRFATLNKGKAHIAQKPLPLMIELLKICKPGDTVLDPFVGSGTTAQAAKVLGLEFVGMDIEERWCREAKERMVLNIPTDDLVSVRENLSLFQS